MRVFFFLDMLDQMLSLHPHVSYFHMGCDEVYYRLVHPQCAKLNFDDDADLFVRSDYVLVFALKFALNFKYAFLSNLFRYFFIDTTDMFRI